MADPGTLHAMQLTPRRRRRTLAHEQIALPVGAACIVRRYKVSHWGLHWHDHPELELTWIVRGAGLRYVGDAVGEFSAGDLVLLGPGVPHTWANEPQPGAACEAMVVQFPLDVLGAGWREAPELRPLATLFARTAQGLQIHGATAVTVRDELASMTALAPGPLRMARLLVVLATIAAAPPGDVTTIARLASAANTAGRQGDPWTGLLRHLHERATGELTMAALADQVGMSPPSFARAFRRRFGTTCTDYLARIRLARVCGDLLDPGRSIAAVAFAAGFANLANFNRRFKAVHGLTPSVWRRKQLG